MSSWAGKLIGGLAGGAIIGPIGVFLGVLLGHQFDRGVADTTLRRPQKPSPRVQRLFFEATFGVMGHIAKSDGRVSEEEIEAARSVMRHMRLPDQERQAAIRLFTEGKSPTFDAVRVVDDLVRATGRRPDLFRAFLEIQIQAVVAADAMHDGARHLLAKIGKRMGFSRMDLAQMEAMARVHRARERRGQEQSRGPARTSLADAYGVLGVDRSASDSEVKTAYRRLMNQHHPDKLRARGMPESMLPVAEERTREIRAAWDAVREARGLR